MKTANYIEIPDYNKQIRNISKRWDLVLSDLDFSIKNFKKDIDDDMRELEKIIREHKNSHAPNVRPL